MTPLDLAAIEKAAKEQKPFGWRYLDSFSGDDDWSITFDVNEATAITEASKDDATYRCEPLFPDQSATILALCARIREPAKVKALVWLGGATTPITFFAESALGQYRIEHYSGGWFWSFKHGGTERHETLNAAKAAAQADYEQRVFSALVRSES